MNRRRPGVAESVWHVAVLLVLMDAGLTLWREPHVADPSGGDPLHRTLIASMLGGSVIALGRPLWRTMTDLSRSRWLLAVLGWAVLSTMWSVSPALTARRSAGLILAALYAAILVRHYATTTVLRFVGTALSLSLAASIVLVLVEPDIALMPAGTHQGLWRGVFPNKNVLGLVAMFTLYTTPTLLRSSRATFSWAVVLCAAAVALIESGSRGPLILALALFPLSIVPAVARRARHLWMPIATILAGPALLLGLWLFGQRDAALEAFGVDPTLTGRTVLWSRVAEQVRQRPLFGYGLGAFWDTPRVAAQVWPSVGFRASHAHNGYLGAALDLGSVGATLVIGLVAATLMRSYRFAKSGQRGGTTLWAWALLIAFHNFGEQTLVGHRLWFVLLAYLALSTLELKPSLNSASRGPRSSPIAAVRTAGMWNPR